MTAGGGAQTISCPAIPMPITGDVSVHHNPTAQAQRSTVAQWQVGNLNRGLRGRDLSIYTLCVHVAARNTSSALLLVEPRDMELQQSCISWAVKSNRFSPLRVGQYIFIFLLVNAISKQKKNQKVL